MAVEGVKVPKGEEEVSAELDEPVDNSTGWPGVVVVVVPNTDLGVVDTLNVGPPKAELVPNGFGEAESDENADTGAWGGTKDDGGILVDDSGAVVGCVATKLSFSHSVGLGFSWIGAVVSVSRNSTISSFSSSSTPLIETGDCMTDSPSMSSGMVKPPRSDSMSSIVSFPNNLSKRQATR